MPALLSLRTKTALVSPMSLNSSAGPQLAPPAAMSGAAPSNRFDQAMAQTAPASSGPNQGGAATAEGVATTMGQPPQPQGQPLPSSGWQPNAQGQLLYPEGQGPVAQQAPAAQKQAGTRPRRWGSDDWAAVLAGHPGGTGEFLRANTAACGPGLVKLAGQGRSRRKAGQLSQTPTPAPAPAPPVPVKAPVAVPPPTPTRPKSAAAEGFLEACQRRGLRPLELQLAIKIASELDATVGADLRALEFSRRLENLLWVKEAGLGSFVTKLLQGVAKKAPGMADDAARAAAGSVDDVARAATKTKPRVVQPIPRAEPRPGATPRTARSTTVPPSAAPGTATGRTVPPTGGATPPGGSAPPVGVKPPPRTAPTAGPAPGPAAAGGGGGGQAPPPGGTSAWTSAAGGKPSGGGVPPGLAPGYRPGIDPPRSLWQTTKNVGQLGLDTLGGYGTGEIVGRAADLVNEELLGNDPANFVGYTRHMGGLAGLARGGARLGGLSRAGGAADRLFNRLPAGVQRAGQTAKSVLDSRGLATLGGAGLAVPIIGEGAKQHYEAKGQEMVDGLRTQFDEMGLPGLIPEGGLPELQGALADPKSTLRRQVEGAATGLKTIGGWAENDEFVNHIATFTGQDAEEIKGVFAGIGQAEDPELRAQSIEKGNAMLASADKATEGGNTAMIMQMIGMDPKSGFGKAIMDMSEGQRWGLLLGGGMLIMGLMSMMSQGMNGFGGAMAGGGLLAGGMALWPQIQQLLGGGETPAAPGAAAPPAPAGMADSLNARGGYDMGQPAPYQFPSAPGFGTSGVAPNWWQNPGSPVQGPPSLTSAVPQSNPLAMPSVNSGVQAPPVPTPSPTAAAL